MRTFWLFALFFVCAFEANAQSDPFTTQKEELGQVETIRKPECSDKDFERKIRETVNNFFEKSQADSTMAKREKVLKLKKLHDFQAVSAIGFMPETDYATANALISIKINERIKEEDIILCKQDVKKGKAIYVIAHPYLDNFKGYIINLDEKNSDYDALSFIYP